MATIALKLETLSDPASTELMWLKLDATGKHTFFSSWNWIGAWLRTLPADISPQVLTASRMGEIIAAAVLVRRHDLRRMVIESNQLYVNQIGDPAWDCITVEHNGFATAGEQTPELCSAFISWFDKYNADELIISGSNKHAFRTLSGFVVRAHDKQAYRRTDLSGLYRAGGLGSSLSRNARQQLNQAKRSFEGIGALSITVATDAKKALEYFEALKTFHIQSWSRRKQPHAFVMPYFEAFHRDLINHSAGAGTAQLMRISAGERPIGYLYNFLRNGRVYAYQSGFDDGLEQLRPGYVCHALAIDHYAQSGAVEYDFLAGTNRLKQSFSNETYEMSWVRLSKPKLRFRAEAFVRRAFGRD